MSQEFSFTTPPPVSAAARWRARPPACPLVGAAPRLWQSPAGDCWRRRRLHALLRAQRQPRPCPQVGPQSLPYRLGIVGDLGQTDNSATTLEHLAASKPDVFVLPGDFSYADGEHDRWAALAALAAACACQQPAAAGEQSGAPVAGRRRGRRGR
jgi:hypothetical protein